MKKILLFGFAVLCFSASLQAQIASKNAIGLRIGDNDGFGAEVSYQRELSKKNRLEFDLGWRNRSNYYGDKQDNNSVKLVGLYQWVWEIENGFNWYVGVGGGFANSAYDYKYNGVHYKDSKTFLLAAGDIGIEYNFDFPLQLSLDFRPEIYFTDYVKDDFGPDIAISARYRF